MRVLVIYCHPRPDIDRKLMARGIRRLCAKDCRAEWLTLTRMDRRMAPARNAFVAKVRRHFAGW